MTTSPAVAAVEVIGAVAAEAFGLTAAIDDWTRARLTGRPDRRPAARAVSGLREILEKPLADPGSRVVGAGFVAAVGLFEDRPWWLEWFVREGTGVERLRVPLDPGQLGFYDYATTRWYREPEADGRRRIVGPYVDHLCTEDQTLTFTQPVVVEGRFVGVAACDVRAATVERELLAVLRRLPATFVVVNDDDRVLCSNSGRYVCGDLLQTTVRRRHGLDDLSLTVVEPG